MTSDLLISGRTPLSVSDAVGAIIRVESDGYLMQLRDSKQDIWYPGRWGLFGGAIEPDEDPMGALKRELREELELEIETAEFFARIDFDLGSLPLPRFYRSYYVVSISRAVEDRKSTRLNSSHVAISYAVFCSKKKKRKRQTSTALPNALKTTSEAKPIRF